MNDRENSNAGIVDRVIDALRGLNESIESMNLETTSDVTQYMDVTNTLLRALTGSRAPKRVQDSVLSLYKTIARKQCELIRPFQATERKRKRETQDRIILYCYETMSFLSTIFLSWYGVSHDVNGWTIFVCGGMSLVSFCALLYFHVGEYGRVEKIIMKFLGRLIKEDEEANTKE